MRKPELHTQTVPAYAHPDRMTWMLTGLLLWLCSLPLIGLLVLPWFGARVALIVAGVLLGVMVAACYVICGWQSRRT
ncbi:MAG: hypothetical protein ACRDGM_01305 [bacterium]